MLNIDRVLTLSCFGHFDPMHTKHTLVLLTGLSKSSTDTGPLCCCSTSSPPLLPPLFLTAPQEGKGKTYILATSIHVSYCVGFALYIIAIYTFLSPLLECKFLEDRFFFLSVYVYMYI